MKRLAVFLLCATSVCFADNSLGINIGEILKNERLFTQYLKCVLDLAFCNAEGFKVKEIVPQAIKEDCVYCNPSDKDDIHMVITYLYNFRRSDWDAILAKYDPRGIYKDNYEKYYRM